MRQLIVRLKGGLGNQLFQYSAAVVLGHEVGAEVLVDFSWFRERQRSKSLRQPEISFIYEDLQEAPDQMWLSGSNRGATPILSRLSSAVRAKKRRGRVPIWDSEKEILFLSGYFQSYKLIKPHREKLVQRIREIEPRCTAEERLLEEALELRPLCVQVRRGDYFSDPSISATYGTLTPEFFERGVAEVQKAIGTRQIWVFSDDPFFCSGNIFLGSGQKILGKDGGPLSSAFSLRLMSQAGGIVISNSSFGWWGAWASHDDTPVVFPWPWVAGIEEQRAHEGLFVPEWHEMAPR